jgi:hypothetical protein
MRQRDGDDNLGKTGDLLQCDIRVKSADEPGSLQPIQAGPAGCCRDVGNLCKFGLAQLSMLLDGTEDADIGAIKTKFFHELKLSPHILVPWKQQASVFCIEVFLGHARRACARFCDTVWNNRVGHRLPRVFSVCWNPWLPVFMHPRTLAAPGQDFIKALSQRIEWLLWEIEIKIVNDGVGIRQAPV